jgi:hypothetical protein
MACRKPCTSYQTEHLTRSGGYRGIIFSTPPRLRKSHGVISLLICVPWGTTVRPLSLASVGLTFSVIGRICCMIMQVSSPGLWLLASCLDGRISVLASTSAVQNAVRFGMSRCGQELVSNKSGVLFQRRCNSPMAAGRISECLLNNI